MKRKIALILTLVMALLYCVPGPAGAAGSTPVFVWQDCAVQLLKYEVFESKYSEGSVALYARVMNNKDYALNIAIEDGEMDGKKLFITSIYNVAPHTDTGTKDPQYFHIYVKSGENAETNFFASARKLTASLQFINQETKEILSSQEFSLDLDVLDRGTGQWRDVSTLSGGESFLASLALALGLSDVVQAQSGAIRMEAMFIDEGFGTLDDNALRNSLRVLADLADGKRLIGIISHVHDLEERIERQIVVSKTLKGSKIDILT